MKNEVRPIDANATIEALRANFQQGSWYGCEEPGYQIAEDTISEMPTLTDHFPDLTKMMPLTPEQLQVMDGPVWCSCKPLEGGNGYWCLCQKGNIITPGGSIYNIKDIPNWVFYAYPPAHIDREAWVSVKDRMPSNGENVLVYAISKYINGEKICIDRLEDGETHAVWMYTHGWFEVTHWMPLPEPPTELEKRMGVRV